MKQQKPVPGILPRLVFTNGSIHLSSLKKPEAVKPVQESNQGADPRDRPQDLAHPLMLSA